VASRLGHLDVVKALIECGANVEAMDCDVSGKCAFSSISVQPCLLCSSNFSRAPQGSQPMHAAAAAGHTEIVSALYHAHANIDAIDNVRVIEGGIVRIARDCCEEIRPRGVFLFPASLGCVYSLFQP
jgi:hypothetical protein